MRQNITLIEAYLLKQALAKFAHDMAEVSDLIAVDGVPEEVVLASYELILAIAEFADIIENNAR